MPYPNHYLLQFGGPRGTTDSELWTCGIRMIPVGGDLDLAATKAYLDSVCVPALNAWFGRPTSKISALVRLNFAKLNRIKADGLYAEPETVANYYVTPVSGGGSALGSAAFTFQVAVALTWETASVSRGLASRGRIYSPGPDVVSGSNSGLFNTSDAAGMATSAASLISALRGPGGAGSMVPNIVSDGGTGVAHRIDRVSVDNRVDIIRKRANGILPVRSRVTVS